MHQARLSGKIPHAPFIGKEYAAGLPVGRNPGKPAKPGAFIPERIGGSRAQLEIEIALRV
jgi:hypothetical protein